MCFICINFFFFFKKEIFIRWKICCNSVLNPAIACIFHAIAGVRTGLLSFEWISRKCVIVSHPRNRFNGASLPVLSDNMKSLDWGSSLRLFLTTNIMIPCRRVIRLYFSQNWSNVTVLRVYWPDLRPLENFMNIRKWWKEKEEMNLFILFIFFWISPLLAPHQLPSLVTRFSAHSTV